MMIGKIDIIIFCLVCGNIVVVLDTIRAEISLTKRLVNLVEKLLLELLVLDQLTDTCQTLRNLVRWQSTHQVKHRVRHDSVIALIGSLRHLYFVCFIDRYPVSDS